MSQWFCGRLTEQGEPCKRRVSAPGQACSVHDQLSAYKKHGVTYGTAQDVAQYIPSPDLISPPAILTQTLREDEEPQAKVLPEVKPTGSLWERFLRRVMPPICAGRTVHGTACHNRVTTEGELCTSCWEQWIGVCTDPYTDGPTAKDIAHQLSTDSQLPPDLLVKLVNDSAGSVGVQKWILLNIINRENLPARIFELTAKLRGPEFKSVQISMVMNASCPLSALQQLALSDEEEVRRAAEGAIDQRRSALVGASQR